MSFYIFYIPFSSNFLIFLSQVMRKLQKFLQCCMAENGNTLEKCLQKKAQQRGNECFYADSDIFFCRAYAKAVDHSRQSVLKLHCQSQSHMKNMSKKTLP